MRAHEPPLTAHEEGAARRLLAAYRAAHPTSRAESLVRYVRNGSRVKQRGCVLCGWTGPTWAGDWPKTATARDAELAHVRHHVEHCGHRHATAADAVPCARRLRRRPAPAP